MIYIIRANHTNEFELQNYIGLSKKNDIRVISSYHPLSDITLPLTKLWSLTDLPYFPYRRQILNRLIGGEQWLVGLNDIVESGDILHTAETYTPYTHQAVVLRKKGFIKKLVCTCWETIPHNNEKFDRLKEWKQESYKYVDIFHTPTQLAKQALVIVGVDPKKIVVIPYGIDLARFKPVQMKKNKRPVVLTVARLEKEKGIQDLEQVAADLPQYDFVVVGRGTYIPSGRNIKIMNVDYLDIHKIYQSADIFFLPSITTDSWEEQYGMAAIEAMATSLPLVVTNSGSLSEVVGEVGLIVPEKNVDKMVKTITDLLSSPEKMRKFSQLSLAHAINHFDSKKIAQSLAELYS